MLLLVGAHLEHQNLVSYVGQVMIVPTKLFLNFIKMMTKSDKKDFELAYLNLLESL